MWKLAKFAKIQVPKKLNWWRMWILAKFTKIQVPKNMNLYVFWIHTNVAKKHVPEENLTVNNNDNYLGTVNL